MAALRRHAVLASLLPPTTLAARDRHRGLRAGRSDPRAARAQDLILRHRVAGYRAGDLERRFRAAGAGGGLPLRLRLHAAATRSGCCIRARSGRRRRLAGAGDSPPRCWPSCATGGRRIRADLAERFGRERAVNGWGGFSKATTRALQGLHYHGLLRVAGRRDGIRVYEAAPPHPEPLAPEERGRRLAHAGGRASWRRCRRPRLAGTFGLLGRGTPGSAAGVGAWRRWWQSGELQSGEVDGVRICWPAARRSAPRRARRGAAARAVRSDRVGSAAGDVQAGGGKNRRARRKLPRRRVTRVAGIPCLASKGKFTQSERRGLSPPGQARPLTKAHVLNSSWGPARGRGCRGRVPR